MKLSFLPKHEQNILRILEKKYALRSITNKDLKVPEKPKLKCMGFTYYGAKLFNMLPLQME